MPQEQFYVGQVLGAGDFGIGQVADDEFDGLTDECAGGSVVREEDVALAGLGEGAADELDAEGLGCLDGPKAGAIQSALDQLPVVRFFDRVGHGLGGNGGPELAGGFNRGGDELGAGAWPRRILNSNNVRIVGQRLEAVPNGVLALLAARDQAEWFCESVFFGQFSEGALHSVPNDHNDVIDAGGVIEAPPGMRHQGASVQFEEKLVHAGSHAGPLAGSDDKGGSHFLKLEPSDLEFSISARCAAFMRKRFRIMGGGCASAPLPVLAALAVLFVWARKLRTWVRLKPSVSSRRLFAPEGGRNREMTVVPERITREAISF